MTCNESLDLELTERALNLELEAARLRYQSVKTIAQELAATARGVGTREADAAAALRIATCAQDTVTKQYCLAMKRLADFTLRKASQDEHPVRVGEFLDN